VSGSRIKSGMTKGEYGFTKQRNVILDAFINCCHSRESGNPWKLLQILDSTWLCVWVPDQIRDDQREYGNGKNLDKD